MRGDVYELKNDPRTKGHEQSGRRYAVVLQTDALGELSTWIVAPTTSSERVNPRYFRPEIEIPGLGPCRVLVEQIRSVDTSRLGKRVGSLTRAELDEVCDAVRLVLELI